MMVTAAFSIFAMLGAIAPFPEGVENTDYATFAVSGLHCVIGDNCALGEHKSGYNGVFQFSVPGNDDNVFVPLYAGVNLEHFFDAHPPEDRDVFFEPRRHAMEFKKIDAHTAELHQEGTPTYGVETWTRFTLSEPYYLDVSFRCLPHKDVFKGGFMGVFWASYMNAPEDKSIYFLGAGSTLDKPKWVQLCTQRHGHESAVLPESDSTKISYPAEGDTLFGNLSLLRYSVPFFYGRVRDKVLIYIFKPSPYLRFAHSPSGGGDTPAKDDTDPAWDFHMVVPDYKVGTEYTLAWRVVCKPWVSRADVLSEAKKYLAQ